jgi:hypothetical protein
MTFYVVDSVERSVSWPVTDNADKGERFASFKTAQKRAEALAKSEPGKMYEIVQSVGEVECAVGKPKVTKI